MIFCMCICFALSVDFARRFHVARTKCMDMHGLHVCSYYSKTIVSMAITNLYALFKRSKRIHYVRRYTDYRFEKSMEKF